jgi:hypothetical protein
VLFIFKSLVNNLIFHVMFDMSLINKLILPLKHSNSFLFYEGYAFMMDFFYPYLFHVDIPEILKSLFLIHIRHISMNLS